MDYKLEDIIKNTKSKNIITTFEGHSWERLFYYFSRKNNPFINCIGFQHTIIFKYQHSLTRLLRKNGIQILFYLQVIFQQLF